MPQGTRKKPFSGKAKKQQLQAKKQRQSSALFATENYNTSNEDKINHYSGFENNAIQKN